MQPNSFCCGPERTTFSSFTVQNHYMVRLELLRCGGRWRNFRRAKGHSRVTRHGARLAADGLHCLVGGQVKVVGAELVDKADGLQAV